MTKVSSIMAKICNINFWIENDPPPFSENSSVLDVRGFPNQCSASTTKFQIWEMNVFRSMPKFQHFSRYRNAPPQAVCLGFSCGHRIMGDKQSCGQRTIMSVRGFRCFVAFTPARKRRPFQPGPR